MTLPQPTERYGANAGTMEVLVHKIDENSDDPGAAPEGGRGHGKAHGMSMCDALLRQAPHARPSQESRRNDETTVVFLRER